MPCKSSRAEHQATFFGDGESPLARWAEGFLQAPGVGPAPASRYDANLTTGGDGEARVPTRTGPGGGAKRPLFTGIREVVQVRCRVRNLWDDSAIQLDLR